MRLQPPKGKRKYFNYDDLKKYLLGHKAVGDGKQIPVKEFFKEVCKEYGYELGTNYFITMWPLEYQHTVKRIFEEINKKGR